MSDQVLNPSDVGTLAGFSPIQLKKQGKLKFNLLLTRLRSILRCFPEKWQDVLWRAHLVDEVDHTLAHVAYCQLNGYLLQNPFFLRELTNLAYTPIDKHNEPVHSHVLTSINADSMDELDAKFLNSTPDLKFWWQNETLSTRTRPTRLTIQRHFVAFLKSDFGIKIAESKAGKDVPGFNPATGTPGFNPTTGNPGFTPATGTDPKFQMDVNPDCTKCLSNRDVVTEAITRVQAVQTQLSSMISEVQESEVEASVEMQGFSYLKAIHQKHGADWTQLPSKYLAILPSGTRPPPPRTTNNPPHLEHEHHPARPASTDNLSAVEFGRQCAPEKDFVPDIEHGEKSNASPATSIPSSLPETAADEDESDPVFSEMEDDDDIILDDMESEENEFESDAS